MEPIELSGAHGSLSLREKLALLQKKNAQKIAIKRQPSVVPLKYCPGSIPIYLIHPIGGAVGCYFELSRLIATKSVYGVRSIGEKSRGRRYREVAEMASDYLQEMLPADQAFILAGWSFGGIVAFEMACQIQASGRSVRAVILIDAPLRFTSEDVVNRRQLEDADITRALRPFLHDRAYVLGKGREFDAMCDGLGSSPDGLLAAAMKCQLIEEGDGEIETLLSVFRENADLLQTFEPKYYPGRLVYVHGDLPDLSTFVYPPFVTKENVQLLPLSGGHYDLLNGENAGRLARFVDGL